MLTFDVAGLSKKPEGTTERHLLNEAIHFDPSEHLETRGNISGKATFMKLPHEIHVAVHDVEIDIECQCSRCLKSYFQHIVIPFAEHEFFIDVPESQIVAGEDYFFVDKKYWIISLREMIRQEILLHFPAVPVCFEGCQGLCNQCGVNLNEAKESCIHSPTINN